MIWTRLFLELTSNGSVDWIRAENIGRRSWKRWNCRRWNYCKYYIAQSYFHFILLNSYWEQSLIWIYEHSTLNGFRDLFVLHFTAEHSIDAHKGRLPRPPVEWRHHPGRHRPVRLRWGGTQRLSRGDARLVGERGGAEGEEGSGVHQVRVLMGK